jgi:Zn-dependent protease with chaperone function
MVTTLSPLCRIVTTPVLSSGSATSARLAGGEQSLVRRSLEVRGLARWVAARPGGWTVAGERLLVVLVDQVVRRNRRHIVVVVTVAVLNYWAAVSVILIGFGWVFASDLVRRRFDSSSSLLLIVACSLALGAVVSVSWVTLQMRYVRRWTLRRIGAVDLHPGELPRVENLLAELAIAAGAPPVRAALVADPAPNALAVGGRRGRTTVVVTSGLVEGLRRDELEAVLAVEMCAVRRLDTALQSVAVAATAGAIQVHDLFRDDLRAGRPWYYRMDWSSWLLAAITWPTMICAERVRRSVRRQGGFSADDMAVAITRNPEALARALRKLQDDLTVVSLGDDMGSFAPFSPSVAPTWFEPVPEDIPKGRKVLAFAPSLEERLQRLGSAG